MEYYKKKCPVKGIFKEDKKEIEVSPILSDDSKDKKFHIIFILSYNHIILHIYP